jgi:hypothetical protein
MRRGFAPHWTAAGGDIHRATHSVESGIGQKSRDESPRISIYPQRDFMTVTRFGGVIWADPSEVPPAWRINLGRPQGRPFSIHGTASGSTRSVIAFSSEVDTGSREENASNQEARAQALIPSKPERL